MPFFLSIFNSYTSPKKIHQIVWYVFPKKNEQHGQAAQTPSHTSINSVINLLSCSIDIRAEPNGIVLSGDRSVFLSPAWFDNKAVGPRKNQ